MPNWCFNELCISGKADAIKAYMEANKGLPARYKLSEWEIEHGFTHSTEPRFCFNALVPTPPEVIAFGYDGHQKLMELRKKEGSIAIAGKIDGYHWNILNWGTKWDIYEDNLSLENCGWEEGMTRFTLSFDTAWSPPIAWLTTVAPMFPDLCFEMHYEEPGCVFAGDVLCEGENVDITEYDDAQCRELFAYEGDE